jgi:tetratricopeptide (TPR) repeat protein
MVVGYLSLASYHYYWVVRWKSDIGGGGAYLKSRAYDKAIASLQDALRVSPRLGQRSYVHADAWTHEHLGEAYRRKGQFDLAATEYRAAIGLDGRPPEIDGRPSTREGLRRALAHDQS